MVSCNFDLHDSTSQRLFRQRIDYFRSKKNIKIIPQVSSYVANALMSQGFNNNKLPHFM